MTNAQSFIEAVRALNEACRSLGIKPPRSINFASGLQRNAVSEAVQAHKLAGGPGSEVIKIGVNGIVSVDGVELKVQF